MDGELAYTEEELTSIVFALSETLGEAGIIIADTWNINVSPSLFCVCYLGDTVREVHCGYFWGVIKDEVGWLNKVGYYFQLSDIERKQLLRYGIITSYKGKSIVYTKAFESLGIPDKIYLRETGFEDREKNIENANVSDEVYLVHVKDNPYDSMLVEVMGIDGSLGYLPSQVGDQLAPLIDNGWLEYEACVCDLVRTSERNRHAKSPLIAVKIVAKEMECSI
jgi:hypothetical protein